MEILSILFSILKILFCIVITVFALEMFFPTILPYKMDYLVIGGFQINMFDLDYFSFKQRQAQELIAKGVPIQLIDEEQFLDLINA